MRAASWASICLSVVLVAGFPAVFSAALGPIAAAAAAAHAAAVDSAVPANDFVPAVVLATTYSAADVGAVHELPPLNLVLPQFGLLHNLLRIYIYMDQQKKT